MGAAMTLGEWLTRGPFGLAMSSGFFSFFAHTGMLSALALRGFVPAHLAGSSAGALVGGAFAAGMPPDELGSVLGRLRRDDFWDPTPGLGLLAGKKFDRLLRAMLPVATFEACRVPVSISAFDIFERKTAVLASRDTSTLDGRDVACRTDLADAIRASCAVPAMFHPVWIGRRPYWDGGILDRPGIAGVPPGRLLFHHITSRSPWRVKLELPRRAEMITLAITDLPRSGPFRLDAGRRALELAREATLRALDAPVVDDAVVISCSFRASR